MRAEKIFIVLFFLSIVMTMLHISGAGFTMAVSLTTLSFFYFPAGAYFFRNREIKKQSTLLSVVAGFFLAVSLIGVLFKLQYLQGANFLLLLSLLPLTILAVIILFFSARSAAEMKPYYKNMLIRTGTLCIVSFALFFTPSMSLMRVQYWNDPQMAKLRAQYYNHPENQASRVAYQKYIHYYH